MSASPRADRLPLTGADCFLRAFDAESRRWNRASHLAQVVLRLGPGFDLDAFRRTLSEVVLANPILRAPIRRAWGIGAPTYRLDRASRGRPPPLEVHEASEARRLSTLPEPIRFRLNETRRGRRGELLRVDLVRYPGREGCDLALTWLHMLFDGAGIEQFLTFFEQCHRGERKPDSIPAADRPGAPALAPLPGGQRERGAMAMRWHRWMRQLSGLEARSPAGPRRRVQQDLLCDIRVFPEAETTLILDRVRELTGFLTPMIFYLAAAIRAHHAVFQARGAPPASYVVPLPVNLRPKGGDGALFRTRVSLLWFQVRAELADDLAALLEELKVQRRRAIREEQIRNAVAAMDYARFVPARLYAKMARGPLRGELCSFFFAYTDAFCPEIETFFEAPLLHGVHVPAVPPSPGSSLALSVRGQRLSWTHVHQRGVFREDELGRFRAQLERDLTGCG